MAQLDNVIADLLAIEGASGAAIVDIDSGMALATGGTPGFDLNVAAAGNSNVVRAKLRTIQDLELKDEVEDILITLQNQYHLINVLKGQGNAGLFIYLVLNRVTANLALARHKLRAVAGTPGEGDPPVMGPRRVLLCRDAGTTVWKGSEREDGRHHCGGDREPRGALRTR